MTNNEKALRNTLAHIEMVSRLLMSAQLELMRRQVTHDRSKLKSPEWEMFARLTEKLQELTYGSPEYEQNRQEMMLEALKHHYNHNRHHPEFFKDGINGMNLFDLLEMLIDWVAATKRHADGDIIKSIGINRDRFGISDQLTQIFLNTIPWIEDEFASFSTQADIAHVRGLTDKVDNVIKNN